VPQAAAGTKDLAYSAKQVLRRFHQGPGKKFGGGGKTTIVVRDFDAKTVEAVLRFVYTGQATDEGQFRRN
jgi:hypothetical protein